MGMLDFFRKLERVLKHPAGHFVRKLSLDLPRADSIEWHLEALVKAIANAGPLPCLTELDLSLDSHHMDQPSWRRARAELGEQKAPDTDDPEYRYTSVGE